VVNLTGDEEPSLVERFVRGETAAFVQVVADHREFVARLAHRLLGWPGDVEDVVQDVFLSAWEHRRKFRAHSTLATWLAAITANRCRAQARKRFLRLRLAKEHAEQREPPRNGEPAMDREAFERVRHAIRGLPCKYREVVVLRYLEDMPTARIAEVLGLSANAVDVRLNRARGMLKSELRDCAGFEKP
jgi:RNA polymerase sigma factor (sigma-70 family)